MQTSKLMVLTVSLLGITSVGALAQQGAPCAPQPSRHAVRYTQGAQPRSRVQPVKKGTFLQILIGKQRMQRAGQYTCGKHRVHGKSRWQSLTPAQRKAIRGHCTERMHKKRHAR